MNIVWITTLLPSTHYSRGICGALHNKVHLIILTDTDLQNASVLNCGTVIPTWRKKGWYVVDILRKVGDLKPDIIHLQHEVGMYGNALTAMLFPILVILLRMRGFKVVVTIHAVPSVKQLNREFINMFLDKPPLFVNPFILKVFFRYIFFVSGLFANHILVHTYWLKKTLVDDYYVQNSKVSLITMPVDPVFRLPESSSKTSQTLSNKNSNPPIKQPYFFAFGYIVRRKGWSQVLNGFAKVLKIHPNYRLVIAGGTIEGQEGAFKEFMDAVKQLKIENNVEMVGFIDDISILQNWYNHSTAVLLPSIVSISASGPLRHAIANGCCVIASNIGTFAEEIRHNIDGILIDNDEWDQAMLYAIDNPNKLEKIRSHACLKAKQWNPEATAKEHLEIYKLLTNK